MKQDFVSQSFHCQGLLSHCARGAVLNDCSAVNRKHRHLRPLIHYSVRDTCQVTSELGGLIGKASTDMEVRGPGLCSAPALSLQLCHSPSMSNNNKRFLSENISQHKLVKQCELSFFARKLDSWQEIQGRGTPELRVREEVFRPLSTLCQTPKVSE